MSFTFLANFQVQILTADLVRGILLSFFLSVSLSLSFSRSICLSFCLSFFISVCIFFSLFLFSFLHCLSHSFSVPPFSLRPFLVFAFFFLNWKSVQTMLLAIILLILVYYFSLVQINLNWGAINILILIEDLLGQRKIGK